MKISIIVPTHNRADQLKNVIESIVALKNEADFEFVIVDNNSTDHTKDVVNSYPNIARYVFEHRTSFTRARRTGGENANGDILLFIDDDIEVFPGSLKGILNIFSKFPDSGVIAAKILPKYTQTPPDWTLACQRTFNGWSLCTPEMAPRLGSGFQRVEGAIGPMMAISRKAYEEVGGFPPDTIGIETDRGSRSFRKLYIGPGDGGLCHNVILRGYNCYYSPDVACYHVIPPIRFTIPFWRSRMIGEGHYMAITAKKGFFNSKSQLFMRNVRHRLGRYRWKKRLIKRLKAIEDVPGHTPFNGMLHEELLVSYYESYFEMCAVLRKYPKLSDFLWEIAWDGVDSNDFEYVMGKLPEEYKRITDPGRMYSSFPVNSIASYRRLLGLLHCI